MSPPSEFLSQLTVRQFLTMAGHTLLIYDYLLTFDQEIDYIWCTPWTTVKVLFLLNRYGTLIGLSFFMLEELGILSHGSPDFCFGFLWFLSILLVFSSETIRALLLLRAWSLWRCSHRVAISLMSVYVIYLLAFSGYISYTMIKYAAHFNFRYLDETEVCVHYPSVASAWLLGLISFLLDTGVFAVIAYYLYRFYNPSRELQCSPLLRLLLQDATLFYMVNVFHDVFTMVCMSVFRDDPRDLLHIAFSLPVLIVTGQRAVLNLRGFQSGTCMTEDISCFVDRQLAEMRHHSHWQSMNVSVNDLHRELRATNEECIQHRMVRSTRLQVMEQRSSYELEVVRVPIGSRQKSVMLDEVLYEPLVRQC